MKFADSIKCFFGKHVWWESDSRPITKNGMYVTFGVVEVCSKCGHLRMDVSEVDLQKIVNRWSKMIKNVKDSSPLPLPESAKQVKELVDSSMNLDLSKMDIDVESFKKVNEELEDV